MGFLIAAVTVLALIYGFFGIRVIRPAKLNLRWKMAFWAVLFIFFAAVPLAVVLRFKAPDHPATIPLTWATYVSFGFFTLAFAALLFRDAVLIAFSFSKGLLTTVRRFASPHKVQKLENPSRRSFLVNSTNLALLGVTGSLTGYGFTQARRVPEIVRVDIPLENLPSEFDGFRILQITDLHVGMTIRRDYVKRVVDRANGQTPDMIVMTGDLADGPVGNLRSEVSPLADLQAKIGKFFVTGNHEYYSGVEAWLTEVKRLGFVPLINEHRIIRHADAEIVLAGITDYRAAQIEPHHASDPKAALAGAPEDKVKVMLGHQPKSVFRAEPAGVDLLIAGHTHGGQYIPFNYLVSLDQPYVHGLHKHGKTRVYVSRGTGYWGPPLRAGAPSEITVLRLIREPF